MKKSSFDFEFSSQANNKKSFAQKMQNERKQRLENKKQQSSALKILHFYRQSVQYASFSELLSKEYMSKLLDLMKIESIVKEKFPLLAKAALDKFNFLRISLLITPTNGEKYYPLMEKLIYLIYITTKKEDIPNITRKIHIKRIAMGLFGMINRGFSPQNSHIDDFFILASKIKGLEIEQKLLRSLLKGRKYNEKMIPILKRITKTILLKSQNSSKKEKEILLFELLLIPNGIANFSPKKIHTLLEMAISQMFGLVKFLKNIKKNEICSISFTNLLQILMKISLEDTILNISFLPLLNGLNQILDLMTGDLENTIMGSQIEIEEENKTMEVEMDIESELQIFQKADNFLVEEQHFDTIMHLDYFFSDEMIGFISKQMKSQLEKKQIFNAHDWELLKNVCHFYTKLLQMKTGSKSRFLLKLSLSSQFIEMLFEIFEIFNFKILNNQMEVFSDIINLFSRLYYQKIVLMDEIEFYQEFLVHPKDKGFLRNFPMEKILTLSKFLNQFVYQNFFLENQKLFKKCKHSAIKLLQELYSRHSLKPFSKELDFWIIKTANLKPNKSPLFEEIPFILPFEDRIAKLQLCLVEDKNSADRDDFGDLEVITIRRGCEIEDGLYEFSKLESLKDMIRIKYVNELGLEEIGIDGGGILKDYLTTCCRKAFDPNYGLFIENEDRTLTPNPDAELIHVGNQHKMMEFLGKLVGKAVYENILIEPIFSRSFLNSLLGRKNQLNDLACIDRALYKSLLFLKHSEDENIIKELGLTFSLIEIRKGKQELIELKENGSNIEVNMMNRMEFIQLLTDFKLNKKTQNLVKSFLVGFESLIQVKWLKMFNQDELQKVISGSRGFNVADLRAHCVLKGFNSQDLTLQYLWVLLETFTTEEQQLFLFFVTGCSRPPLLGFEFLQPKFAIQRADYGGMYFGEDEMNRLPTSATCMNLLRLPDYNNLDKLREKLLYSIKAKSGFDLS